MKGGLRKMEVYTVSCHGGQLKASRRAGAHTHPLLIPELLSSRLQPSIPSLVFISGSVMSTKESTHSFAAATARPLHTPPVSWSLQARLAGLISNCDLTAWWKDWHTCTNTRGSTSPHTHTHACAHTYVHTHTHTFVAKRRTRASFARSNKPLSKTQGHWGGQWGGGSFAFSNVSYGLQETHIHRHLRKCICLEAKDWTVFWCLSLRFFIANMLI